MTIAAYVGLNLIRAGVVAKVEDDHRCAYTLPVGGNHWASFGYSRIVSSPPSPLSSITGGALGLAISNKSNPSVRLPAARLLAADTARSRLESISIIL